MFITILGIMLVVGIRIQGMIATHAHVLLMFMMQVV